MMTLIGCESPDQHVLFNTDLETRWSCAITNSRHASAYSENNKVTEVSS